MPRSKEPNLIFFYLLANALVLLTVVYAGVLESNFEDWYFISIQEDEYMEWATVWAFLFAGAAALIAAARRKQETARFPWYLYGLSLFCVLVALEEFSWGQRIFGYRPPAYFLEHNFQQELNIHNVIDTSFRKLVLTLVILGYGIVLPVLGFFQPLRDLLLRLGIEPGTVWLIPAFLGTYYLYDVYPWGHTGEWVELMLGCSMLFSLVPILQKPDKVATAGTLSAWAAGAWVTLIVLGMLSGAASRVQRDVHPATMQAARDEVAAIKRDFESGRVETRCNLHKRLYTFVVQYGETGLLDGEFATLQKQGLPSERADFLIDPWNSPYWLRDRCDRDAGKRYVFVYSFGPDRNRDSTTTEILGDDVGAYIQLR
ncbi:MAG: hypothetical protein HKN35_14045 [Woeseia sp.]|nr:hypothetical protein [Woeseia sp.]MBT8097631.1 hypothetical protein [Woeseia sp.]NNE62011.1 hypothetical protein [Woeseia sp.]NNL55886.1 hypothetical protein [Woeseia sp.]